MLNTTNNFLAQLNTNDWDMLRYDETPWWYDVNIISHTKGGGGYIAAADGVTRGIIIMVL